MDEKDAEELADWAEHEMTLSTTTTRPSQTGSTSPANSTGRVAVSSATPTSRRPNRGRDRR